MTVNRPKSIQLSSEAIDAIEDSRKAFVEKFGREPGPDDPFIFDPDADTPQPMSPEKMTSLMVKAMIEAKIDGRLIYTFVQTGLILTEETYRSVDQADRDAWNEACDQWGDMSRQQRRSFLRTYG